MAAYKGNVYSGLRESKVIKKVNPLSRRADWLNVWEMMLLGILLRRFLFTVFMLTERYEEVDLSFISSKNYRRSLHKLQNHQEWVIFLPLRNSNKIYPVRNSEKAVYTTMIVQKRLKHYYRCRMAFQYQNQVPTSSSGNEILSDSSKTTNSASIVRFCS